MKLIRFLATLLFLSSCDPAYAQSGLSAQQAASLRDVGVLKNPGFENGKTYWTASAGTFTVTTTAADVAFGTTAGSWDASASSQTLTSDQVNVPPAGYGSTCTVKFWYKGGDSNLTARVIDGSSTTLVESVLRVQSVYVPVELDFACPTSSTFAFRLVSTADAAVIKFDQVHVGVAPQRTPRGPTNLIAGGDAEYAGVSSSWSTYDDGASAAAVDGTGGSPAQITAITRGDTAAQRISGNGYWTLVKAAADAQGEGWAYDFTLPTKSSLYSSLVTLSFTYYMSVDSISDAVRVYLYDRDAATLITPQFVTCGGGSTPSLTSRTTACKAELAWVSTTSDDYRLIFHVASSSTTALTMYVDDLYTGEFKAAVGAAVGSPESVTFTSNWVTNVPNITARETRVGNWAHYEVNVAPTGDPTGGSLVLTMPAGRTIDTTVLTSTSAERGANRLPNSQGAVLDTGTQSWTASAVYLSSTTIGVYIEDDTASGVAASVAVTNDAPVATWVSGDYIQLSFRVPIAEWSGGTAFGENRVEYACNSDTSDAADTTSFVSGYAPCRTPGDLTAARTKRIRFATPARAGDVVQCWIDVNGDGRVVPALGGSVDTSANVVTSYDLVDDTGFGQARPVSGVSTDFDIAFRRYRTGTSGWSGASTARWFCSKSAPNVAVGFGLATSTTPGLYTAGQTVGTTSNAAACTGCVGEVITSAAMTNTSTSAADTEVDVTGSDLDLTPGAWSICVHAPLRLQDGSGAANQVSARLTIVDQAGGANTSVTNGAIYISQQLDANAIDTNWIYHCAAVNISSATSYELRMTCSDTTGGGTGGNGTCLFRVSDLGSFTGTDNSTNFYATRVR